MRNLRCRPTVRPASRAESPRSTGGGTRPPWAVSNRRARRDTSGGSRRTDDDQIDQRQDHHRAPHQPPSPPDRRSHPRPARRTSARVARPPCGRRDGSGPVYAGSASSNAKSALHPSRGNPGVATVAPQQHPHRPGVSRREISDRLFRSRTSPKRRILQSTCRDAAERLDTAHVEQIPPSATPTTSPPHSRPSRAPRLDHSGSASAN